MGHARGVGDERGRRRLVLLRMGRSSRRGCPRYFLYQRRGLRWRRWRLRAEVGLRFLQRLSSPPSASSPTTSSSSSSCFHPGPRSSLSIRHPPRRRRYRGTSLIRNATPRGAPPPALHLLKRGYPRSFLSMHHPPRRRGKRGSGERGTLVSQPGEFLSCSRCVYVAVRESNRRIIRASGTLDIAPEPRTLLGLMV